MDIVDIAERFGIVEERSDVEVVVEDNWGVVAVVDDILEIVVGFVGQFQLMHSVRCKDHWDQQMLRPKLLLKRSFHCSPQELRTILVDWFLLVEISVQSP